MDRFEHTLRPTEGWKDNTARISFDTVGNQYVTFRAQYEHTKRDLVGLDRRGPDRDGDAAGGALLRRGGSHARPRLLDPRADAAVLARLQCHASRPARTITPGPTRSSEFGLLDNKNTSFSVGFNYTPSAKLNLGADYGRDDKFDSLQQSRNANPAPDPSWTDPNRNWTLSNDEKVNNFSAYLNLVKAIKKTDIRASYDLSDSDQAFVHGGPRIPVLAATAPGQFIALPNVTNKWQRAMVDLKYSVSAKVGLGLSYWYEKFDVEDFAAINTAGSQTLPIAALGAQTDTPRIDYLGSITTGYGNRPYKGQTAMFRLFYEF